MFAQASDAELLQQSPLIVIGTWVGQSSLNLPGTAAALPLGVINVSEVLKGATGQTVVFVAVPGLGALRSSSDIHYRKGDHGLWLLKPQSGADTGVYLADHPQRFVPSASAAARIETLRKALAPR